MIYFGSNLPLTRLPEVTAVHPAMESATGDDGQSYAQVAMHPSLLPPELAAALDLPTYRARRILLPSLASLPGFGDTARTLSTSALLNAVFLAGGLVWFIAASRVQDYAALGAAAIGEGTLVSFLRALTDLPSATLSFFAAAIAGGTGAICLAASLLARESAICSRPILLRGAPSRWWGKRRHILTLGALAVTPLRAKLWEYRLSEDLDPSRSLPGCGRSDRAICPRSRPHSHHARLSSQPAAGAIASRFLARAGARGCRVALRRHAHRYPGLAVMAAAQLRTQAAA